MILCGTVLNSLSFRKYARLKLLIMERYNMLKVKWGIG